MGRFLNGVLVGIGIGLLVAPMKGEEMRRQVRESFQELQTRMPDNEQLKQGQQMAAGVSQAASQVKDSAQQATSQVKQPGQDVASTAKQTTPSMKPGRHTPPFTPIQGVNEPSIFADDMALDEGR